MRIEIQDESTGSCEVPITRVNGEREIFERVAVTLKALEKGSFYEKVTQLHKLFTESPEFFIETYEEPGKRTYALRPGVSELLDSIRIGATKIGGGYEMNIAFKALVFFCSETYCRKYELIG